MDSVSCLLCKQYVFNSYNLLRYEEKISQSSYDFLLSSAKIRVMIKINPRELYEKVCVCSFVFAGAAGFG